MNFFTTNLQQIIIAFCLIFPFNCICQGPENANDVKQHAALNIQKNYQILPSVEGATLGEYGEYAVNLYTGATQIGVPIYTLKGNKLQANVGLNYKASGIKVADAVSMAGVGWSITGLPVISRVVVGDPDMRANYYSQASKIKDGVVAPTNVSFEEYNFLYDVANSGIETQPDQYYYSLLGKSGNFYISPDKEIIQTEYSDILIDIDWDTFDDDIKKFTITDENGNVYTFDISERTLMHYDDVNGLDAALNRKFPVTGFEVEYNSSWHASKITTYDNSETFEYTYHRSNLNLEIPVNYGLFTSKIYTKCDSHGAANPSPVTKTSAPQTGTFIKDKRTVTSIKRLVGVTEAEKLTFTHVASDCNYKYTTDRKLNYIRLNRLGGNFKLRWNFSFDCSTDRLTLTSLTENNQNNTATGREFSFTYNSGKLLAFNSPRIDHWGYFNGINALAPLYDFSSGFLNLNRRKVDPAKAKYGSLTSITYPTGGKTNFVFESNQITKNTSSTNYTPIYNGPFIYNLESCGGTNTDCCQTINGVPNTSQADEVIFFNDDMISDGYVNIKANAIDCDQNGIPLRVSQGLTYNVELISESGVVRNIKSESNVTGPINKFVKIPIDLNTGYHTLSITGISTYVNTELVQETTTTVPVTEYIGGLRIKEINHYDIDDTQLKKTIYKYTKEGSNESSGLLFARPDYLRISNYKQDFVNSIETSIPEDECTTVTVSNSNSNELLHVQGSPIGYSRVEEIQVSDFSNNEITNGKTVFNFHNELFSNIEADPVYNGKMQLKEVFDSDGDPVYSEEFTYSTNSDLYDRDIDFYGYKVLPDILQNNKAYLVKNGDDYTWTAQISEANNGEEFSIYESKLVREDFRRMVQAYVFPISKKETWHYGIDQQISKQTNYEYANNNYLQPTKESVINSNGREYYSLFYYPDTYASGGVKNKMELNNIILPSWKTEQYVKHNNDITQIDGSITEWADFSPDIYPSKERRYEMTWDDSGDILSNGWIDNVFYVAYDEARGMPSTIRYRGWEKDGQLINHMLTWSPTGKLQSSTFDSYIKSYEYHDGNDQLEKVTNIDETTTSYLYDALLRLSEVKEDCTGSKENIDYNYYNGFEKASILLSKFYPTIGSEYEDVTVETKQYMDGLGRNIESVRVNQDPNSTNIDIFEGISYDNLGRAVIAYEPALSEAENLGQFVPLSGDVSLTVYENSPLNRPISSTPPNWFATNIEYGVNVPSDLVKRQYSIGTYTANSLHKTTTTDANGNKEIVFTDKIGREILTRRQNSDDSEKSDTYTVYDNKHRVTIIIPPGARNGTPKLLYTYLYSGDDLILQKKVPDQELITYTYDDRDLMLSYQDGYLRAQNKQYNYLYDHLGRVLTEGLAVKGTSSITQPTIINTYGTSGIDIGKIKSCTKKLLVGSGSIVSNFTYDNCGRLKKEISNHPLNFGNANALSKEFTYDSQHNILEESETITSANNNIHELTVFNEYDRIGRHDSESLDIQDSGIQGLSAMNYTHKEQLGILYLGRLNSTSNYLQKVDYQYTRRRTLLRINDLSVDENGSCRIEQPINTQRSSAVPDLFSVFLKYHVDQTDCSTAFKPLTTGDYRNDNIGGIAWQVLGREKQVVGYDYDYLDRIEQSTTGTNSSSGTVVNNLYNTSYTYSDSRGNLKTTKRNGYKENSNDNFSHGEIDDLLYNYDSGTNRLNNISDSGDTAVKSEGFNRKATSRYTYSNDTNNDGLGNGNILYDPSRKATIEYNHLNLPNSIIFDDGNELHYVYDGRGKLHQRYQVEDAIKTSERTYIGHTEFENGVAEITHHSNGFLRRTNICDDNAHLFLSVDEPIDREYRALDITSSRKLNPADKVSYLAEDFIKLNKGFSVSDNKEFLAKISPANCTGTTEEWRPYFTIKDHLGNTRIVFANLNGDNTVTTDEIVSESHYYPFGLQMTVPEAYKTGGFDYLYNGKELQRSFDLGYYDYGARFYDPSIGRFTSVDPLASEMPGWAPYSYTFNNPINLTDPTGMYPEPPAWLSKGINWIRDKVDLKFSAKLTMGYQIGLKNNFIQFNAKHVAEIAEISLSTQNGSEIDYIGKDGEIEGMTGAGIGIGLGLTGGDPVGIGLNYERQITELAEDGTVVDETISNEVILPNGFEGSFNSDDKVGATLETEVNLILIGIEISGGVEIDRKDE